MSRCLLWIASHNDASESNYSKREWTFTEALKSLSNQTRMPDQIDISRSGDSFPHLEGLKLKNLIYRYRGQKRILQLQHIEMLLKDHEDEGPETVVFFLDDDDLLHPNRIQNHMSFFETHPEYTWSQALYVRDEFPKTTINSSHSWWDASILSLLQTGRKKEFKSSLYDPLLTRIRIDPKIPSSSDFSTFNCPYGSRFEFCIPQICGISIGQDFSTLGCKIKILREFFASDVWFRNSNDPACDCDFLRWIDANKKEQGTSMAQILYFYRREEYGQECL